MLICLFVSARSLYVSPLLAFFLVEGGLVSKKKKPVVCHSLVLTDIQGKTEHNEPLVAQINGGILLEWGCLLGMGCIHVHQNVIQYGQYFNSRTFTKQSLIVIMSILCIGKTAELSVFISHVIKTNNRNCSINKFKNLGYDR